ncbi:MAG: exonuclease SbcCD subunit D [Pseudomonadota bacterium]
MRILHTSDWHLGRLFHQLSLLDDQRYCLDQVLQYIEQYKPDVVIIAGDIYDRSIPPSAAVTLFNEFVNQCLTNYKVPIIAISGNHDGAERLGFAANQLKQSGLHLITSFEQMLEPVIIEDQHGPVYFWGVPFHDPAQVAQFTQQTQKDYNQAHQALLTHLGHQPDARNVMISHCYLDGASESESERPLSIGGADRVDWQLFKGFSYTALGHLHQPQHKGQNNIRYSGSLMKYSFSEQHHKKAITKVDIDSDGEATTEQLALTPKYDVRVLTGSLTELIDRAEQDDARHDYLQVVLTDKEALLNPMARLRQVYPNVLELRKQRFQAQVGDTIAAAREQLKRSDLDVFADFFKQVQEQPMSEQQRQHVAVLIEDIAKQERNE